MPNATPDPAYPSVISHVTVAHADRYNVNSEEMTGIFWTQDEATNEGYSRLKKSEAAHGKNPGWNHRTIDVGAFLATMPDVIRRRFMPTPAAEPATTPIAVSAHAMTRSANEVVSKIASMFGEIPFVLELRKVVSDLTAAVEVQAATAERARAELSSLKYNLRSVLDAKT